MLNVFFTFFWCVKVSKIGLHINEFIYHNWDIAAKRGKFLLCLRIKMYGYLKGFDVSESLCRAMADV